MAETVLERLSDDDAKRIKEDSLPDLSDKKKLKCCSGCGYLKDFRTDESCPNGCEAPIRKKFAGMIALVSPSKSYAGRVMKTISEASKGQRVPGLYAEDY